MATIERKRLEVFRRVLVTIPWTPKNKIVVDSGTDVQGDFAEACGANSITLLPIDRKAPWQNGRTERAVHEWKQQFKHTIRKGVPTGFSELVTLGLLCYAVRNRYNNRSVFSPMQRV